MSGFAILILVVAAIWLLWPMVSRWLKQKASEKTEDFLRDAMGMPPRPGSRKDRRQRKEAYNRGFKNGQNDDNSGFYQHGKSQRSNNSREESLIPKEYAEDVEFTEIKTSPKEK